MSEHESPTLREWLESAPIQKVIDDKTLRYQVINADEVLALLDRLEAAEAAVERVRALAERWDEDHKRHLAVTRRSAPNHRPCESGARAKAGQMIRAAMGAD